MFKGVYRMNEVRSLYRAVHDELKDCQPSVAEVRTIDVDTLIYIYGLHDTRARES